MPTWADVHLRSYPLPVCVQPLGAGLRPRGNLSVMASAFMADVLDMAASVNEVHGELFTLFPRVKDMDKNAPDLADLSRAPMDFTGVFLDLFSGEADHSERL